MKTSTLGIHDLCLVTEHQGQPLQLLQSISLELHTGEVLALIGASGSGKSLTCSASLDLLPPGIKKTSGTITVDGQTYPAAQLRGRSVATIMQNPRSAFNPVRTMRQHAYETFKTPGVSKT